MSFPRRKADWRVTVGGLACVLLLALVIGVNQAFPLAKEVWWKVVMMSWLAGFLGIYWYLGWGPGRRKERVSSHGDLWSAVRRLCGRSVFAATVTSPLIFGSWVALNAWLADFAPLSIEGKVVDKYWQSTGKSGSHRVHYIEVYVPAEQLTFKVQLSPQDFDHTPVGGERRLRLQRGRFGWLYVL